MNNADWSIGTRIDYELQFKYQEINKEINETWERLQTLYKELFDVEKKSGKITKDLDFNKYLELKGVITNEVEE